MLSIILQVGSMVTACLHRFGETILEPTGNVQNHTLSRILVSAHDDKIKISDRAGSAELFERKSVQAAASPSLLKHTRQDCRKMSESNT